MNVTPRTVRRSSFSVNPAIVSYSQGEISASKAADLLGPDATIHDVVFQLREAGLSPPREPREVEQAQLAKARRVFWARVVPDEVDSALLYCHAHSGIAGGPFD